MVIGIDCSRLSEAQKTGVEGYALFLLRALITLESTDPSPPHVSYVLYLKEHLQNNLLPPLPKNWSCRLLSWPIQRLWTQGRFSFEMCVNPPDVLFIPAHVFPVIRPKHTVMMIHDIASEEFPKSYSWFERWYARLSTEVALRHLPRILVPSLAVKNSLCTFFVQAKKHSEKIVCIHHGYNPVFQIPVPKEGSQKILERYKVRPPYVFFLGRLETKKNTPLLIKAFDLFRQRSGLSFSSLVLAGKSGYGYEQVLLALHDSPYQDEIRILPWVPIEDAVVLLQNARLFVFPSQSEGFGLPVLEACAAGVPVVCSSLPALKEIGGDAPLFCDPHTPSHLASQIERVWSDESLRQSMVAKGRERLAHFSWEKTARETRRALCTDSTFL